MALCADVAFPAEGWLAALRPESVADAGVFPLFGGEAGQPRVKTEAKTQASDETWRTEKVGWMFIVCV